MNPSTTYSLQTGDWKLQTGPQIGRWHVVDPMAEKYYDFSPYHFAGLNPVSNREVNGAFFNHFSRSKGSVDWHLEDETNYWADGYVVDEDGNIDAEIVNDEGGDEYDVIYNKDYSEETRYDYDKTGNKPGIRVSKGIVQSAIETKHPIEDFFGRQTGEVKFTHRYEVQTDEEAQNIMSFFARNTNVEWANTLYINKNGRSLNVLATFHDKGKVYTWFIHEKYYNKGYDVVRHDHIHPGGSQVPLGNDLSNAKWILSRSPNAKFRIYANDTYHPYSIPNRN